MTKEFGVKVKNYIWQAWVTKLPETRGQHMFHMSLPLNEEGKDLRLASSRAKQAAFPALKHLKEKA